MSDRVTSRPNSTKSLRPSSLDQTRDAWGPPRNDRRCVCSSGGKEGTGLGNDSILERRVAHENGAEHRLTGLVVVAPCLVRLVGWERRDRAARVLGVAPGFDVRRDRGENVL